MYPGTVRSAPAPKAGIGCLSAHASIGNASDLTTTLAMDEYQVSGVDEQAARLPDDEDRILPVDGVNEQCKAAAQTERQRHDAVVLAFLSTHRTRRAATKKSPTQKPDGQPEPW